MLAEKLIAPSLEVPVQFREFCENNRLVFCGVRNPAELESKFFELVRARAGAGRYWLGFSNEEPGNSFFVFAGREIFD